MAKKTPIVHYVSVEDAGAETGLSPWTWRRWAYDRKIASVKVGKRLLIPRAEVDRLMAEGYRPAAESAVIAQRKDEAVKAFNAMEAAKR